MVLVADVLYIGGFFLFYYGFLPVICSWSLVHQSSMFRVDDVLRAVSYTVTEYEWIFSSLLWFFPCVSWSTPCSSLSDPWCYLQTPCVSADFFPVCCGFFPVIHSWACVHQSSIFRVVDVLCAVSYTVAEDEWIFSSLLWIFSCVSWPTPCSSLGPQIKIITSMLNWKACPKIYINVQFAILLTLSFDLVR